jgi:hypothetical protein
MRMLAASNRQQKAQEVVHHDGARLPFVFTRPAASPYQETLFMTTASTPQLSFLATFSVSVGPPHEIGPTVEGVRRVIPILGGSVQGPQLNGSILPMGADYQLLVSDTLTELDAKYAIEVEGGERIYVTSLGVRSGEAADIARLVRGEPVDPERIYFRCTQRLVSAGPTWSWLADRILVGTGRRLRDQVEIDVFVVE